MKYRVPRLPTGPGAALWITDLDEKPLVRVEIPPHGRLPAVVICTEDGGPLAAVHLRRRLTGTTAAIELGGAPFATLALEKPRRKGAVHVRRETRDAEAAGEYVIAGDFEAWDFHVLLNTSPVAEVAPRRTEAAVALVETSDHEEQVPLLALVLGVDLLVSAAHRRD